MIPAGDRAEAWLDLLVTVAQVPREWAVFFPLLHVDGAHIHSLTTMENASSWLMVPLWPMPNSDCSMTIATLLSSVPLCSEQLLPHQTQG